MKAFGFDIKLKAPQRHVTVEDYRQAARRRLPDLVWAYLDGGSDDLNTLRDNRSGFAAWSLKSLVLTAKGKPDLSTTLAGEKVSMPVMLAPTGYAGLINWKADIHAVKAAEAAGTKFAVSTASSLSIDEIAKAAQGNHFFQLYPREGDLAAKLMHRAWEAGYRTLFLTVDVPAVGNREGERRKGMGMPPTLTPRRMLNIARYPGWALDVLRHKRIAGRNFINGGSLAQVVANLEIQNRHLVQSRLSWDDFAWVRDRWKGRVYIKGVLEPQDAVKAVDLGADGVIVSNHGGRQLDFCLSSIAALPGIADAVGQRAEVLLDGGVRRGTDVIKAIALGAKGVLIGRPYLYGIAAEEQVGAERVLEILRTEIERSLILMGAGSIAELDRSWLIRRGEQADDRQNKTYAFDRTIQPVARSA